MKKYTFLLTGALLATATVFAQKATETRNPGSFNTISIAGGFSKMILKAGAAASVELKSAGGNVSKVETEVKNNTLQIQMKKGTHSDGDKITVVVTYTALKEINTSGSTDVEVAGTLKADKLKYNASGSGDLKGSFDVADLEVNIAGSAEAQLSGNAKSQHYAISGSGDIDASGLKGDTANVAISGSGDVALNVEGDVKSAIAGSGHVVNKRKEKE